MVVMVQYYSGLYTGDILHTSGSQSYRIYSSNLLRSSDTACFKQQPAQQCCYLAITCLHIIDKGNYNLLGAAEGVL
jgi:hypothetical protein